jgi:hypothetical protein
MNSIIEIFEKMNLQIYNRLAFVELCHSFCGASKFYFKYLVSKFRPY